MQALSTSKPKKNTSIIKMKINQKIFRKMEFRPSTIVSAVPGRRFSDELSRFIFDTSLGSGSEALLEPKLHRSIPGERLSLIESKGKWLIRKECQKGMATIVAFRS